MRPKTLRLSAAGSSPWIVLNHTRPAFGVGVGVKLSDGASLTYSVQHTFDNIWANTQVFSIARSTTTATVTKTNHGLAVGDWVNVWGAGAPFDGQYTVASVVDANNFTYTVANSGATASAAGAYISTARVFSHDTLAAQTTSQDGNYQFPPIATRLNISSYTSGFADITVIAGVR